MINVIVHRSIGNGEVGSMWHESYAFDEATTLAEVIAKCRANNLKEDIVIPVKEEN